MPCDRNPLRIFCVILDNQLRFVSVFSTDKAMSKNIENKELLQ